MFKHQNRNENASAELISFAANLVLVGKCDQAKDNAKAALALFRGQISLAECAMVYASCNDASQAESLFEDARTSIRRTQ